MDTIQEYYLIACVKYSSKLTWQESFPPFPAQIVSVVTFGIARSLKFLAHFFRFMIGIVTSCNFIGFVPFPTSPHPAVLHFVPSIFKDIFYTPKFLYLFHVRKINLSFLTRQLSVRKNMIQMRSTSNHIQPSSTHCS